MQEQTVRTYWKYFENIVFIGVLAFMAYVWISGLMQHAWLIIFGK